MGGFGYAEVVIIMVVIRQKAASDKGSYTYHSFNELFKPQYNHIHQIHKI